ncbi:4a-hydroxytetrahydrobiopterin dehydratase [Geojedonia litorea]|uniref:Putative pterin-4-alpha-carbinolamine dehydratase n=1 Tax=Geojedonia litorea TaxID=1268269 RepID=A0ABV9N5S4_9FLAO
MSLLNKDQIEQKLLGLPDWDYFDNAIHAEFEFENFKDCFSAMSRIAFECEAMNHHPNWSNVYNVLTISLSTHSANGVTEKDFKLAEAIDAIVVPEDE